MEELYYTIKEASERLGVTYRTLHHYEDKFNLPISRDHAGNRLYSESNIATLEYIVDLKSKGLTLDGIKNLLEKKGILDQADNNKVLVIDENTLEIKDMILSEISATITKKFEEEMKETKETLNNLVNESKELKEELRNMQRDNQRMQEEHFRNLDQKLTAWRESKDRPWYKKIFGKNNS